MEKVIMLSIEYPIEEDKIMIVKFLSAKDYGFILSLKCKALLKDIEFTVNLLEGNSLLSKYNDAVDSKVQGIEDIIGAQVAIVFNINCDFSLCYHDVEAVFPVEQALEKLLVDL